MQKNTPAQNKKSKSNIRSTNTGNSIYLDGAVSAGFAPSAEEPAATAARMGSNGVIRSAVLLGVTPIM